MSIRAHRQWQPPLNSNLRSERERMKCGAKDNGVRKVGRKERVRESRGPGLQAMVKHHEKKGESTGKVKVCV